MSDRRFLRDECLGAPLTVSTSRVAMLAVDTGLGVEGVPVCDPQPLRKCRRCRRRRCRC